MAIRHLWARPIQIESKQLIEIAQCGGEFASPQANAHLGEERGSGSRLSGEPRARAMTPQQRLLVAPGRAQSVNEIQVGTG